MTSKIALPVLTLMLLSTALSLGVIGLPDFRIVYALPYTDIDVDTAYNMIINGSYPDLVVLDVRTKSEYDGGHIYGAVWISHTELETRIGELSGHENDEIIVYCGSGVRSVLASEILDAHNFTKVYNMLGGITAWQSSGYPVWIATVHNLNTTFNYDTIQAAVDAPQTLEGHTILVDKGTYYEHVTINKSISLVGENEENTTIYGSGNGTVVYVFADNVNISRFTIRNSGNLFFDGGIYLNKSQGCSIDRNRINVEGSGIIVSRGYENHLFNNRIGPEYSWYGIYLINSSGNIIVGNIQSTSDVGIKLVTGSCHNNISGNHIINNICANICLDSTSHNNTITNNKIYSPGPIPAGSILVESEGNVAYHNNFYNGIEEPIIVYHANNVWDNGYPSGGNYWSDHNPPDIYSGPYQNETGRDKIGDIPYIIGENNLDRYPLIYPHGYVPIIDLNSDGLIDIVDIVIVALAFGSRPGDPNWNPYADLNEDGLVDIVDLVMIALHFGETYP